MTHPPNDPSRPPEREREIIVTDGGRRGGGAGTAIAVILGVIVVIVLLWMLFTGVFTGGGDSVNVDIPDEVDVNVDAGDGEG
ncbi:MAG TPA: hypothetical protein VK906_09675 [Egicoccus sp.]|nr:hypothetical protein [Egicoccus sp.]HSK23434.1 hypothetical protein [Egicoccus sp.]